MTSLSRRGVQIQARQHVFSWFLLATLLPILVMPFSNLDGNYAQRFVLPLTTDFLVFQSLRMMPLRCRDDLAGRWMGLIGGDLPYRLLGLVVGVVMWLPFVFGHHSHHAWHGLILGSICLFYLLTGVRILQLLSQLEGVNVRSLCLGCAGYIHLGLTAGQLANFLQVMYPGSFAIGKILPGEELLERLNYFSFVTLAGIGYGDVLPKSPTAEFFAVLLNVAGVLYLSLVIGLLLSRYINDQTMEIESKVRQEVEIFGRED